MKKLCLTAAAAALLVLTACGAKKAAPVVTEMNTVFYGADGSQLATQRTVNTYDEKGLALRTEIEQDGTLLMRLESTYNEDGVLTGSVQYDSAGNVTGTNTYDENGNLLTLVSTTSVATPEGGIETGEIRRTCTYDGQGRLLEDVFETPYSTEIKRYTYNDDGTGAMELERDGAVQYTDTLTLDENGNIQTQTRSGDTGESVTTYNGSGDLLSVVATDANGEVTSEQTYTYDKDGNLLSEVWNIQGTPREITYTYDEYGNELSRRRVENGVLAEESTSTVLPLDEALAQQADAQ